MKLWQSPQKLFKATAPRNLSDYIGRTVIIPEFVNLDGKRVKISEEKVTIQSIAGNRFQHNFYEINGKYLLSMLRFHAQMLNANDITEEQFEAFEDMEVTSEKLPENPVKDVKNEQDQPSEDKK